MREYTIYAFGKSAFFTQLDLISSRPHPPLFFYEKYLFGLLTIQFGIDISFQCYSNLNLDGFLCIRRWIHQQPMN